MAEAPLFGLSWQAFAFYGCAACVGSVYEYRNSWPTRGLASLFMWLR